MCSTGTSPRYATQPANTGSSLPNSCLNCRMDAIGADQHVDRNVRAIVEAGLDDVSLVREAGEAVAEMNALAWKSGRNHRQQIATVDCHMWRTVELLAQWVERGLLKCAPVLPA